LRHDFAPDSTVLASFIYQHRDSSQTDSPDSIFVGLRDRFPNQNAFGGELQYLFRSRSVSLTSGFGYSSVSTIRMLLLSHAGSVGARGHC